MFNFKILLVGLVAGLAMFLTACANVSAPSAPTPGTWELEYRREGGFIGYMDRLVLNDQGACALTRRTKSTNCTATPELLRNIQTWMAASQFATLRGDTTPPGCCDHISYSLRYRAGSSEHSISFADDSTPTGLQELMTALDKFIATASAN